MPKCQVVNPSDVRKSGQIEFKPIPVNQYSKSVKDELKRFSKEDLVRIQRDMIIIRTFENMLNEIKLRGVYNGIEYMHKGPAHLSIGQEAAAVGQAYHLDIDDHIYGSHRSHGEILAKGLSAIEKLDEKELMEIMENYFDGWCLKIVEKDSKGGSVKDLAIDFLIYGTLAEVFGREPGLNKGMGGSMHAFFPPFGVYPNNAIVGGSGDISVGAALFKKVNQKKGIIICNIGDASSACGPVWEGLCFATMDQFKQLWDDAHKGGLPLIMNFNNNFYGMGGQPEGETMGFGSLARIGAGINPDQMHAERIDGYNPLAVADAIDRKRKIIENGDGPVLIDTVTYRYSGHSPSDQSSYRQKEEIEAWMEHDSTVNFGKELVKSKVCDEAKIKEIAEYADGLITKALGLAADLEISPRADLKKENNLLERTMFSNEKTDSMDTTRKPEVLIETIAENPRTKSLESKSRSAYDENGERLKDTRCVGYKDALFEAIIDRFYTDPTLVAYGEENRDWGGAFAVYRGLTEALPYHRLFNSPIAEAAIAGTSVGYALEGGRALIELMYCDFLGRAGDEVFNQLCKWQSMSGGLLKMPVTMRVSVGSKYGAQHSQDWTALCAHIPGLKIAFPATPYDAKGLMQTALTGTDPVIFFESQRLYGIAEEFQPGGVPTETYSIEFGEPAIRKEGTDLTILTIGATLYRAIEASKELEDKYGLSCEIIDARTMVPFNYEKVIESVKKTRKILLASDACERGSFLHTMASNISTLAFDELDAPPVVLGAKNWITPPDEVEDAFFPYPSDFIDIINEHIIPLKGYKPIADFSSAKIIDRNKKGI